MRCGAVLLLVSLASCASTGDRSLGIPPCNAWIFLWGAADLKLDCQTREAIPVLERKAAHPPVKPPVKPAVKR